MNHIYKVIWNKAKHCYTVVSEIAKSHSQSNKRVRSMTAVVAAAMMLTGFGGMAIEAANPAPDDTNIKIGKGADFAIWNGQTGHDGITSGYIAIGENAYAWDGEYSFQDYLTRKWSARIGTKEYLLDFNQGAVGSATWGKYRVTDGTKLAGAIAIGKNTMARTGSVMIGDHTYVGKLGDIEVDPAKKMTLNDSVYSTTLGSSSYNSGSMSAVTGAFSIISNKGTSTSYGTQNFGATIYGSLNSIESSSASSHSAGMANSVLGFGNRTQNTNASLVWGTGNEVTNSIENVTFSTKWNKTSASDAQKEIIKAMQSSDQYAGGSVMAIGGGNKADWAIYSQLLGVQNTLTGTEKDVSKLTMINGYKNTVTNAQNTTIIGSNNTATNIQSTIVMGDHNTLEGRKNVISLGNKNTVMADDAVAIGNGTKVTAESGVAIGAGSVADRVAGSKGAFAPANIPKAEKSTWISTKGAFSVGEEGKTTRQITNVAAGSKPTDAVNVAQLKQVASQTAASKTTVSDGTNTTVTPTTVAEDGHTDYKVNLNKDLTGIESMTNGSSSIRMGNGGTVTINKKVTIDQSGKISGVAAGSEATDAVNVAQLKQVASQAEKANQGWNLSTNGAATAATNVAPGGYVDFSGDDNVSVSNKETQVTVALKKDVKLNSATFEDTVINANGLTIGGGTSGLEFSKNRVSVGGQQIHDVADGKDDADAVNVSQLKKQAAASKTTVSDGTNTTVTSTEAKDGHIDYKVNLNKDVQLHSATFGDTVINANGLTIGGGTSGLEFSKNRVSVGGQQIHDVADGKDDADAVNVSQLKKQAAASKTTVSDGTNTTVTSTEAEDGHTDYKVNLNENLTGIESMTNGSSSIRMGNGGTVTINNRVTIDQSGKISGVAAGSEATDAVNVAQLKQVAGQAEKANQGWNLSTNGVATAATNVAPGGYVDFSGDDNITVSNQDTKVKVSLNKDINVNSVQTNALNSKYNLSVGTANENGTVPFFVNSNGAFYAANGKLVVDKDGKVTATEGEIGNVVLKNGVLYKNTALRDGELYVGDADGNYSQITPKSAKLGQVTIDEKGNIAGANSIQTNALNAKYNLSVGTANENGTVPFFVNSNGAFYAANGKLVVDKDGKVTATEGEIGNVVLKNGVLYKNTALRDGELYVGDVDGNYSQITTKGAKLGKVTVAVDGKISGVAAGAITADSTDAVNGSQLHAVATEAGKHSKVVSGNNINVEETDVDGQKFYKVNMNKDIMLGDLTGKNVSISGTNGTIEATGAIATKDRVYADKGAKLADIDVTGDTISNGDAKLALNGAAGTAGMINGKGASVYMQDGYTVINSKVAFDQNGKISGVAAGAVTADSTDAVNGSQLHAVATEAGKHSKVVSGNNINVEETDVDGQKFYKVNMNKDIMLGDLTGKNVSISGTNGTIETTGFIATKDKIYADKGAKLADVNVTGDTISNDKSSVKLDKDGTVTINNRVTINQSGKISGVAAGEISSTSTDAVNGSQLKATNDRVFQVEGNITEIKGDITNIKSDITNIKGDVKNLGDRVTKVEQEAGKHTKVVNGSNVTVEETDQDGQKTYKVGLNKDLLLGDITGKNVSISGTNGTIETTGSIATKDKIYADKGAKLADIDITGDTISNGQSSVKLDKEGTVTINGKVSVNQDGKVSGVAAGDISEKSTDAVNGSQLFATNQQVVQNAQSISKLGNRINKVGAGAAALAALHPLDFDPDDKWDIAAGYGNYNGENAAAIGAYYRPNEDTMLSVGGSFGNGENMVNAGVSLKLGQGNHVSTSKVAMAKEIKDLRKEMEGLKSALLDANAGKKLDTSKLQLFPDVPKNHWAYEYVSTLKGNGVLTGYPDGEFKGDRPMTRYEFATMLYKAMLEGATLSDRILKEFAPELERFTVDTVHQDKDGKPTVERVRTVKAKK